MTTELTTLASTVARAPHDDLPRLLVVDDERINRELLSHVLKRGGYQVTTASNGREALELIAANPFDLVLLDVVMPELDGFACLRMLRATRGPAELPVIMATAESDREKIVDAFRLGANDYVVKPIDPEVTLARIATLVRLSRADSRLRQSEERYALAAKGSNAGLYDWDVPTDSLYLSPRWKEMLGFSDDELAGNGDEWMRRIHPEDSPSFRAIVENTGAPGEERIECELRMRHRDDNFRWMLCTGVLVRDANGKPCRLAGSLTDITEGKVRDALTKLPNRLHFEDRLKRAVLHSRRKTDNLFAVLFLDLDNFKLVNDSLGHQVGDMLLTSVAERLDSCLRGTDTVIHGHAGYTVARQGGDEFAILLERLNGPRDAERVAERIMAALSSPMMLCGHAVGIGVSIGIAMGGTQDKSSDDLLREADTAMYYAKSDGRGRFRMFDPDMHRRAAQRLTLLNDLRQAVREKQFFLRFQPIVRLESNSIEGFEALVRWQHPRNEVIGPDVFVQAAEELGVIHELGHWVFEAACRQCAAWSASLSDTTRLTVNVNCSAHELRQPGFRDAIERVITETGVDPQLIKIEVTESTLMTNPEAVCKLLTELRTLGLRIGIDDFGTGYSSLAYLHRLPLDVLKIDKSFVRDVTLSRESLEVVRSILALGLSLGLTVVAEGVETEEQRTLLMELGCTHGQGYLFSQPLSAIQAAELYNTSLHPSLAAPTIGDWLVPAPLVASV